MRNGNLLKSRISEIHVKRIRGNQGVGVQKIYFKLMYCDFLRKSVEFPLYSYGTFSMILYHKLDVKNGCPFTLQFFLLISDSLGGVVRDDSCADA